jgi:predicted AlkP superfamily pyrophosphatase or phosphodiesterase
MRQSRDLSLFVFVDALGWGLVEKHGFLADLLPYRQPVESVLGYSSTCVPTILTGRMPREHGHMAFFAYDPARSPFRRASCLAWLPSALARRARVRRLISKALQAWHGYTGYFQIYNVPFETLPQLDYTEKRDLYQPGGINGGLPTIFDHLREGGIPFSVSDWRRGDAENLQGATDAVDKGDPVFAYVYLSQLDGLLHAEGTRSPKVPERMAWYEGRLRHLIEVARRRYRSVRLHVISDHGMADIGDTCNLMPQVDALGLRQGHDYAAVYDSTMARFWFLRPGAREAITSFLREHPQGRLLSDEELRGYGADFPDQRFGEAFFLLRPGTLLCPSHMGEKPIAGMHGYDPRHADSLATFASTDEPERAPRRLDDLFGVMRAEASRVGAGLGLRPAGEAE